MQTIKIGRLPDNNEVFNFEDVSRNHCILREYDDGKIEVEDLDTLNGTFLNGSKVKSAYLRHGDTVSLANKYIVNWEHLFRQRQTVPGNDDRILSVLPQQKSQAAPPAGPIIINQQGSDSGSKKFSDGTQGVANIAKTALYIGLAVFVFWVLYKIFS